MHIERPTCQNLSLLADRKLLSCSGGKKENYSLAVRCSIMVPAPFRRWRVVILVASRATCPDIVGPRDHFLLRFVFVVWSSAKHNTFIYPRMMMDKKMKVSWFLETNSRALAASQSKVIFSDLPFCGFLFYGSSLSKLLKHFYPIWGLQI